MADSKKHIIHTVMSQKNNNLSTKHKPNDLSVQSIFKLVDLYFTQSHVLYWHQLNSFDKFLEEDVPRLLEKENHVFYEKMTPTHIIRHRFSFTNITKSIT